MREPSATEGEVFEVPHSQRDAALAALMGIAGDRVERCSQLFPAGRPELLLGIQGKAGRLTNAALLRAYPGRTAMLMVTPARNDGDAQRGISLVSRAIAGAGAVGAVLVQALVEPLRAEDVAMYEKGGMRAIGTLAYLERALGPRPSARVPQPQQQVTIRPWDPRERDQLERLLERTYVDSLDCPGLAQMRTTRDILDGHMETGVLDPSTWFVLEVDSEPQGVSLLSELPSSACGELVYFGLAREARGKGLGSLLLDHTIAASRGRGQAQVVMACDERNDPAMRLYKSRGFTMRLRRRALVASVKSR